MVCGHESLRPACTANAQTKTTATPCCVRRSGIGIRCHERHLTASLLLIRPLSVGQAPAAPERLVEPDMGEKAIAADLRQRVLRRVELLLGLEHLEVVGEPLAIAIRRMLDGFPQSLHGYILSCLRLAQLAQGGESVRDFPERSEHRLLVLKLRLLPLRDGRPVGPKRAARVEERTAERAGDSPYRRAAAGESRHLGPRRLVPRG